jgi:hypothetical protein
MHFRPTIPGVSCGSSVPSAQSQKGLVGLGKWLLSDYGWDIGLGPFRSLERAIFSLEIVEAQKPPTSVQLHSGLSSLPFGGRQNRPFSARAVLYGNRAEMVGREQRCMADPSFLPRPPRPGASRF